MQQHKKKLYLTRQINRWWLICFLIIFLSTPAFANPWAVEEGKTKLFLEYTYADSKEIYNIEGKSVRPNRTLSDYFIGKSFSYGLFAEYGLFPYSTAFYKFNFARKNNFTHTKKEYSLLNEVGLRFSFKPEEENLTLALEASYTYKQVKITTRKQFKQTHYHHVARASVAVGKSWEFYRVINPYWTLKASWESAGAFAPYQTVKADTVFGLNLKLRWRILFIGSATYTRTIKSAKENTVEEYTVRGSAVLFPFENYGLEVGYGHTIAGKNIHRARNIFTKLWIIF